MAVKKKVVEIDTKEAQTSVRDLRNLLKELKDVMLSTEKGTEEYNDALRKSADIMHTLKEQQEELSASAMDFGQIAGNCTKAVGGLVGGLLAAKAMMTLFGVENEDVIKSLQKMQSLMAITQALPAIDNGIKAFKRLALVIKSATGAAQGFKAALVSTGLGALVVALGAMITYWDDITAAITGTNKALEEQAKLKEEERLKKVNDQLEKRLGLEKQIRKAAGQTDLETANAIVKSLEKEINGKELLIELNRREYAQQLNKIAIAKQNGKAESYINNLKDEANKLLQKEKNLEADIKSIKEGKLKTAKEELKTAKLIDEANKIKEAKEAKEKAAEEAKKKAADELKKLTESYRKLADEIALYNKSEHGKALAKLAKEEAEKIKIIEKAEKDVKVREERIAEVRKYYANERLKTELETAFKELKLLEDNHKLQEAALQASLDNKEITLVQFNERKKELDEAYKEDYVSTLQAMLEDETLSVEKRLELYEKLNEFRAPAADKTKEKSEAELISEAINASALALSDFSDNPAWGNILKNVATLAANWDKLNKDIKEGGTKAFTAYAQIAATALSAVAQMFNGLAAEQDQSNREGFESAKKFQIAGATMSMLAGITSAWASSMQLPFPANVIIGSLLSTMMGVTGGLLIAKISRQQFDSKSSASATATPSTGAITSINAPVQYTQDVQGAEIEGAIKDTRVYVVESDITNTQNRVNVTENEAKF